MTTPAQPEKSTAESCSHSIPLSQPCMECTENETATTRTATHIPVLLRFMAKLVKFCVATETLQDSMSLIAKLATQVLNLRSRLAAATERANDSERESNRYAKELAARRATIAELTERAERAGRERDEAKAATTFAIETLKRVMHERDVAQSELKISRAATDKTRQDADAQLSWIGLARPVVEAVRRAQNHDEADPTDPWSPLYRITLPEKDA